MTLGEEVFQHLFGSPLMVYSSTRSLFHRYRERYPDAYIQYRLSTQNVCQLLHVDTSTVYAWVKEGKLNSRMCGTRTGNLIRRFRRYRLKDLADFLVTYQQKSYNEVEHTTWTPQEIQLLVNGIRPEGRSRLAYRCKKCRIQKQK